ncbi:MAG: hypothetical protein FWD61_15900 [Phycisphaerales bacterium]|nr:hypothetical protein [Phycisphaerales bacterium]
MSRNPRQNNAGGSDVNGDIFRTIINAAIINATDDKYAIALHIYQQGVRATFS